MFHLSSMSNDKEEEEEEEEEEIWAAPPPQKIAESDPWNMVCKICIGNILHVQAKMIRIFIRDTEDLSTNL
jgi:hypothetical protein